MSAGSPTHAPMRTSDASSAIHAANCAPSGRRSHRSRTSGLPAVQSVILCALQGDTESGSETERLGVIRCCVPEPDTGIDQLSQFGAHSATSSDGST